MCVFVVKNASTYCVVHNVYFDVEQIILFCWEENLAFFVLKLQMRGQSNIWEAR